MYKQKDEQPQERLSWDSNSDVASSCHPSAVCCCSSLLCACEVSVLCESAAACEIAAGDAEETTDGQRGGEAGRREAGRSEA